MKHNRVLFVTDNLDDIKVQQFFQIDFQIIRDNGYDLTITDKLIELFKFWKYDILFHYFYTWAFFTSIPAFLAGKKIYHTGGIDALNKETASPKAFKIQKLFFWLCYHLATKCIIVSDTDWNNIEKAYNGKLRKKLTKSYHTIDVDKFKCDIKGKNDLFVSVCWQGSDRNVLRKGLDKSLVLFHYLSDKPEFRNYKYVIIGKEGPGTPFLKQLIAKKGLQNRVILTGAVSEEDKINYLKQAKYYFQLSYYEGFGLAALEAEAASNIIIHSGKGGLKYVVGDNGILVDRDNIENDCSRIYENILNFDNSKIYKSLERVNTEFRYETRRLQFAEIFKS